MAWYRCYVCRDLRTGLVGEFKEFEADRALCPFCGAGEQAVVRLTPVHLLIEDVHGPILSGKGGRYRVGCMPSRDHLATHQRDEFAATGDPRAVTCRSCKGTQAYYDRAKLFPETAHRLLLDAENCC